MMNKNNFNTNLITLLLIFHYSMGIMNPHKMMDKNLVLIILKLKTIA